MEGWEALDTKKKTKAKPTSESIAQAKPDSPLNTFDGESLKTLQFSVPSTVHLAFKAYCVKNELVMSELLRNFVMDLVASEGKD